MSSVPLLHSESLRYPQLPTMERFANSTMTHQLPQLTPFRNANTRPSTRPQLSVSLGEVVRLLRFLYPDLVATCHQHVLGNVFIRDLGSQRRRRRPACILFPSLRSWRLIWWWVLFLGVGLSCSYGLTTGGRCAFRFAASRRLKQW